MSGARIVVVGGGFGGATLARRLGRRNVTLVTPENFMLFTPMLPEAASGTLEPRHVVVPLRLICRHATLVLGRALALDEDVRSLTVMTDVGVRMLEYDHLVLALGSVSRTLPIPGLAEHAVGAKTFEDALYLRNHVLRELEAADAESNPERRARHLTFLFVGAGYAGVETLGELRDLVDDALRFYPKLRGVDQRWVLVDAASKILPEVPTRLGEYAARQLARRGIDIRVSTTLERVEERTAHLSDGTALETRTVVWTAGTKPHPLLARLGLPVDERGRVRVDETLRVEGRENVWALGDCARVPNVATPGAPDPPMSQFALQQAKRLAENVLAADAGHPLAPYRYRSQGWVATLGRHKGVAEILGVQMRGFPAWFATRTIHLFRIPHPSRRLRVVADWTLALLFRRDIVAFGSRREPPPLEEPVEGGDRVYSAARTDPGR